MATSCRHSHHWPSDAPGLSNSFVSSCLTIKMHVAEQFECQPRCLQNLRRSYENIHAPFHLSPT
jgi:hypothetical protein